MAVSYTHLGDLRVIIGGEADENSVGFRLGVHLGGAGLGAHLDRKVLELSLIHI